MVSPYVFTLMSPTATNVSLFGAKVANLSKATHLGFAVPEGLVISRDCDMCELVLIAQDIIDKLSPMIAVRPSATMEVSSTKSYAGIFETRLNKNLIPMYSHKPRIFLTLLIRLTRLKISHCCC